MGKHKESISFFKDALQLMDSIENPDIYSSTCNNIANSYMVIGDYENMLKYRKIALNIRKKMVNLALLPIPITIWVNIFH